jgi:ribosomal protein S18 acetylase RimI-like enzyme
MSDLAWHLAAIHLARRPSLTIRLAAPEEFPAIGDLTHAAYTSDYTDLPTEYREQLRRPEDLVEDFEVWVAEDSVTQALLGTVSVLRPGRDLDGRLGPGELYFRLLAVHPSARGLGIGAALTTFAIDFARQRGLARVVLNSGPDMLGAHALYRKLGFERQPSREGTIVLHGRELTLFTFTRDVDAR